MRTMVPVFGPMIVAGLLAAGCRVVNPTVDQLQTFKDAAGAGDYASIAGAPVGCAADRPGCAQVHAIKADACRRTASGAAPVQRDRLDCAAENYAAAIDAAARRPDPAVDAAQAELGLLDALHRRRDAASDGRDAAAANTALADRAAAARRGPNANPAGLYYGADAGLNEVLRQGVSGGCAEIAAAARLAAGIRAQDTAFAGPAGRLAGALVNARAARRCPA